MGERSGNDIWSGIIRLTLIAFVFAIALLFFTIFLLRIRDLSSTEWTFVKDILPSFILTALCIFIVAVCYRLYSSCTSRLFTSPDYKWLLAILSLGILLRFAYVILVPTLPVSDFRTYHDFAVNMITNGVYGYGLSPDNYRSPGESFFLYVIYKLAGSTDFIYPKLVQVVLGTLNIAFVYFIAKKTFDEKTANIAALLMAVFPTQIFYTSIIASENLFTFINLFALSLFVWLKRENRWYYPSLFAMGLLLGCAALVRPVSLLLPVIILAILLIKDYTVRVKGNKFNIPEARKFIAAAFIVIIAFAMVVAPWCIRNYIEFGHFSISSNGGLAFWVGNNENATGQYNYAIEPIMNEKFGNMSGLNDFQRENLLYSDAKQFILSHPIAALILDVKKLFILYGSSSLGIYWSMVAPGTIADQTLQYNLSLLNSLLVTLSNGFYYLVLFTALIGLPILARTVFKDKNYLALMLIFYILYFSIMYSISLVDDRYNFNVLPILAILAAFTISKALWPVKPPIDAKSDISKRYL